MKKIILLTLLAIAMVNCKPKEKIVGTTVDNKTERVIKGNWTISAVTYPGQDYIKVTSFDIADSKCFVGSKWKFITNNNKGEMALNNAGCTSFSSPITFYINNESKFVMKILNETKSKKVTEGYILNVANVSENSFQLVDKANVGGKGIDVVYQFNRN
jgi:hypothetical protein